MKKVKLCYIFIFLIIISCSGESKNIYEKAVEDLPTKSLYSNKKYEVELLDTIRTYAEENGEEYEFYPYRGAINYDDDLIYIYDKDMLTFLTFDLDTFIDNSKVLKKVEKSRGKGPSEINQPIDMLYLRNENAIYISDFNNYAIYKYNMNFEEIERYRTEKRPFSIFNYKGNILYSNYFAGENEYNLKYAFSDEIFSLSRFQKYSKNHRENVFFNQTYLLHIENDNLSFIYNNYKNYYVIAYQDKNKSFVVKPPKISKINKNKSKIKKKVKNNQIYNSGLYTYYDNFYMSSMDICGIIVFSGRNMKELGLSSYLWLFNSKGETLLEMKIPYVDGEHSSIIADNKNKIIYYFTNRKIYKYKITELQ